MQAQETPQTLRTQARVSVVFDPCRAVEVVNPLTGSSRLKPAEGPLYKVLIEEIEDLWLRVKSWEKYELREEFGFSDIRNYRQAKRMLEARLRELGYDVVSIQYKGLERWGPPRGAYIPCARSGKDWIFAVEAKRANP